jgi:hypothetical protein
MKIEVKEDKKEIEIYLNGNKIGLNEFNSDLLESIVESALLNDFELDIVDSQTQHPISLLLSNLKSVSKDDNEFNIKINEIRKNKKTAKLKLEELDPNEDENSDDDSNDLPF